MPTEVITSILLQIPIVALFVWYNERKDRQFQQFLREQREADRAALERLASILEQHDRKTDVAIATMQERTKPAAKRKTPKASIDG